jgi:cell division septum initiation protein DivIVA
VGTIDTLDTLKIVDRLESLVEDSRRFLGFFRFDDEEFYMLVSKLRASLPEDVRRAGKITQNSERIVEAAQSEAEQAVESGRAEAAQLVQEARARAQALVEQSEIVQIATAQARETVQIATAQAREIVGQAEAEAREIRTGADDYACDVLATLEGQVGEVLSQVEGRVSGMLATIQRGRHKLEQRAGRAGPAEERREPAEVAGRRPASGVPGGQNGRG